MAVCLAVCWEPSGVPALRRCRSKWPTVVATDDPRVQESARTMAGVRDVTFIESNESFWHVAQDVKATIARVDVWLRSLEPSLPPEALSWSGSVEGGLTGQRVQDALLLIRSYQDLIRRFDAREVHIVVAPGGEWEAGVFDACARSLSLPVTRHRAAPLRAGLRRVEHWLRPFAMAAYVALNELRLGAVRTRSKKPVPLPGRPVLFQLCSSARKHVDNVRYLMAALIERGHPAVAICWAASERAGQRTAFDQLRSAGLPALALEPFVSAGDMAWSLRRSAAVFVAARRERHALGSLDYQGVAIAPLLEDSIRHFLVAILPARLRYARAIEAGLAGAAPAAIKPWGGGDFFEGRTALRLTHGAGAVYFHYWVGAGVSGWPYTDLTYRPDLFLAKSPAEARVARDEYRLPDANVAVVGNPRWKTAPLETVSAGDSRRTLGLPAGGSMYVGVDAGVAIRGYQSRREQVDQLTAVLKTARQAPRMVVAVKPHPAHSMEHLTPIIQSYIGTNLVVLPRTASVEHFLSAMDLIVTKYSTLILEAALVGRPAVAAIFDGESRFMPFGDLPSVVRSPDELQALLERLASDPRVLQGWVAAERTRQQALLPEYYCQGPADAGALASEAIARRLASRDNLAFGVPA